MKLEVYVFRHTETYDNKNHIFSGDRDVELTPEGLRQAELIAEKLKDKHIGIAFTSPLKRAEECLYTVLKYHPHVEIIEDKRLIERSYGWLEGHSKVWWAKHFYRLFKVFHRSFYIPPPGGESLFQVKKRVDDFLVDFISIVKEKKTNAVIACHSNSIRPIRQYFEHLSNKEMVRIETELGSVFTYYLEV